ncbi:MAG: phage portal protein, partial [Clostridia bacterium]|nr:phage portal protein [Clostridia bacterium]
LSVMGSGYGNHGANRAKKSLRGWLAGGGSAKEDIEDNLDLLRRRSRDACMGIPTAAAALKTLRTNVLAGGLIPAPQVDAEYLGLSGEETEALQQQILREFSLWADHCDADGIDDFYQLQQLAFLSALMNGDVFAVLPMEERDSPTPYSLKIRLIEADRVCSPDLIDRLAPCEVGGRRVHRIVQGIETDAEGAVVARWICSGHPLSSNLAAQLTWQRVETRGTKSGRRTLLHLMERERVGQLRGVPRLAPVLEALKQLGRYPAAEVNAALVSAMITVFIQSDSPSDARPFGELIPEEERIDDADRGTIELAPAAIVDLAPGETIAPFDPKHPTTTFDTFQSAMLRQIAAALEIAPEVLQKQFSTSYSAARGALNEFWRVCTVKRDNFVTDFCQPVYESFFAEAVAKGRIKAPGFFSDPARRMAYTACAWNGPARTNLNPAQEVEAAVRRVEAGFSTAQEETAQMTGGDWSRNIRIRQIEAARKREVDRIAETPAKEQRRHE